MHRRGLLLGLLALGGCGFRPIYGNDNSFRDRVSFTSDDTVAGFQIRQQLEKRLGSTATPDFALSTQLSIRQRSAAITADGDTSRFNVIATARWSLKEIATGREIAADEVQGFTSFSATSSTVATQATQDDAVERLTIILADMIVSRIFAIDPETGS